MTVNALSPLQEHALGNTEGNDDWSHSSHEVSVSTVSHADGPVPNSRQQVALEERRQLGKQETRVIWWLRIAVLVAVVAMAVIIAVAVHRTISNSEEETFEKEFKFYAGNVIQHFNRAVENKLHSLNTLSVAVTSHAIKTNSTFPFVTLPDFELSGCNSRIMGDNTIVMYTPYVSAENRFAWEEYSRNNNGHVRTGFSNEERAKRVQDTKFGLKEVQATAAQDAIQLDVDAFPVVFFPENGAILFGSQLKPPNFPVWHFSPVLPPGSTVVNVDIGVLPDVRLALNTTMESGEATIADLPNMTIGQAEAEAVFDLVLQYGQYRHRYDRFLRDPLSTVAYPVFDSFGEDRSVVGFITSLMYWRFLFSRILPEQIRGIFCVIENTFGHQVTFELNGLDASYVGVGDLHHMSFDSLGESIVLQEYMRANSSPETQSFKMVNLNQEVLNYTLSIYPSQEFKDIYVTDEPGRKAAAIAMIFVAILLVFAIYECCVQRRQRIVLDRAVKATAAVSSLFPQNVREHVINEGDSGAHVSGKKAFLNSSDRADSRPLVEKHAECTVVFLDLDGFTKWSSTQGPVEVFELLEAVFKEFDSIAQHRRVFKVETIGQNYLAVTGLPEEQADHAVRMAKFASDCLWKLDQLTMELKDSLGDGVEDLTLRIGMHSGEITSGVFRGEKTRFQLVGDTVNTASRMQSTGVARHIQCSQSTADQLIMAGKSSWLTARVEKVKAKGKGEMQTYFIRVPDKGANSQGTSDTGAPRSTTSFTSGSMDSST